MSTTHIKFLILFLLVGLFFIFLPHVSAISEKINYSETKKGSIIGSGSVNTYIFSAERGDSILIKAGGSGGFWTRITLFDPSGHQLKRDDDMSSPEISHRITSNGTYTILVDDYWGSRSGNYTLSLILLSTSNVIDPSSDILDFVLPNILTIFILGLFIVALFITSKRLLSRPKIAKPASEPNKFDSLRELSQSQEGDKSRLINHDVIISYSNHDKIVADAICNSLESNKIRCWYAPRDIIPGKSFAESIIDAVDSSLILVIVFSSYSNESSHVISEVTEAMSKGVVIIPFRIEDVQPSQAMKYLISKSHWLDAMTPPLEKHIETLCHTVMFFIEDDRKRRKII